MNTVSNISIRRAASGRVLVPAFCLTMLAVDARGQLTSQTTRAEETLSRGERAALESRVKDASNHDWTRYVPVYVSQNAMPIRIISTSGDVRNSTALLRADDDQALILTRGDHDTSPTNIVLDYGEEVGGVPIFDVTAVSGHPELRASYSESLEYMGIDGDHGGTHSADPNRFDTYKSLAPGVVRNTYVQGGQRYQMISLTSPGSISLKSVYIERKYYRASKEQYRGHFLCSDEQLNRIWYAGALTVETNMLPPGGNVAPYAWVIDNKLLKATGVEDGFGMLRRGLNWTDYTAEFSLRIKRGLVGWTLHSTDQDHGYVITLDTRSGIQAVTLDHGREVVVAKNLRLQTAIQQGIWYAIRSVLRGTTTTIFINGEEVLQFDSNAFAPGVPRYGRGTVGFHQLRGDDAEFTQLKISAENGELLYSNSFDNSRSLDDFVLPLTSTIPVIVDGAKRDRSVWSGDLAVQSLVIYDSTFATEYVRNSLLLLGSNAGPDGRVATNLNAEWPVHTGLEPSIHRRIYSANYTLWWAKDLADYFRFTGDTRFAMAQWPTLSKELAWANGQLNKDGLFETKEDNGSDWDYYDGPKKGAVTSFNALYYRVLCDVADMADAVGKKDEAQHLRSSAQALRATINRVLFNTRTGLYDVSDQERGTVSQDSNVLAVLYGVASKEASPAILAKLRTQLSTQYGPKPFGEMRYKPMISPFISGFELVSRFETDDDLSAFDLLSTVWSPMLAPGKSMTGTFWENISLDGKPGIGPNTSLAHGWAAMPSAALSMYVLGVRPVGAGYSTWSVKPHMGTLVWARGSVPTPHGNIEVAWNRVHDGFELQVSAPRGTRGQIAIPTFGPHEELFLNGKQIWNGRSTDGNHIHADGRFITLEDVPGGNNNIRVHFSAVDAGI